ncbi:MAG: hypothetical protein HY067_15110 [Betaproteobacteria bacterium]|nr:hypothetical protein [Betaproteobacteria bacterium]
MFAAVPHRMFPYVKESFMGPEEAEGTEPLAHAELWGGLERDLERLQGLLDGAVEQLRRSFTSMSEAMNSDPAGERLRERFCDEADRVITCLQFHDVASQMISNMRGRAELLEIAALTAAPGAMAEARSRLLAEALQLSKRRPDVDCDRSGDVDLF